MALLLKVKLSIFWKVTEHVNVFLLIEFKHFIGWSSSPEPSHRNINPNCWCMRTLPMPISLWNGLRADVSCRSRIDPDILKPYRALIIQLESCITFSQGARTITHLHSALNLIQNYIQHIWKIQTIYHKFANLYPSQFFTERNGLRYELVSCQHWKGIL